MFSVKHIETGVIFEKCTIQEITDVERKLRQDIEKKKEDLRQMVGKRYRELIEAADTITDMKNGTEKVATSIINLQELCQSLNQSSINFHKLSLGTAAKTPPMPRNQLNKFNQAVCMKLLMDIPNKIWSCLDKDEYLNATRLYLLAHHLHSYLRSGLNEYASKLINIVVRQWTTISHLKTTIIKGVETKLMDAKLTDKLTAECLCLIILLKEVAIEEVFVKFLRSREELIKQYFDSCGMASTVKPLVCDVVNTIITTLRQVDVIFVAKDGGEGLLISMLQKAIASDNSDFFGPSGFGLSEASRKYLPQHVREFKSELKIVLKPIEGRIISDRCSEFVNNSSGYTHRGIEDLLSFVTTVRALADIRDAVYLLVKDNLESCNWQSMCTAIMGREFDVWEQLLRKHFLDRLKRLVEEQMDALLSTSRSQVQRTLEDFADANKKTMASEKNLSGYVWSESPSDVPQNAIWTPINQKMNPTNRNEGGLHMKSKGHTPGIQSLCLSIDGKVKVLLEDVTGYINPSIFQNVDSAATSHNIAISTPTSSNSGILSSIFSWRSQSPSSSSSSKPNSLEELFADKNRVLDLLRTTCSSFLSDLLEFLKSKLRACRDEISSDKTDLDISISLQRALYMGRISSGLSDLTPSLQKCISQDDLTSAEMPISTPTLKTWKSAAKLQQSSTVGSSSESKKWMECMEKFDDFGRDVYSIWSDHLVGSLTKEFERSLHLRGDNMYSAFISSSTLWDSTVIEEENEEGSIIKSTIKVPMQVSWYVQDLLYKLCMEINKIGGHIISGSTINNLTRELLSNILSIYQDLLSSSSSPSSSSSSLFQSRALQMWFDVKYLVGVLASARDEQKNPETEATTSQILDKLECHVDPFDLDVFRPHLKKHLNRLLKRSNTLYGLVLTSDRSSFTSSSSLPSSSGQEHHHIVPLSTGLNRFPLLPLSQQATKQLADAPKMAQKALAVSSNTQNHHHNKTFNTASSALPPLSNGDQNSPTPPRAGSSSFLEQMSTLFSSSSATSLYIK